MLGHRGCRLGNTYPEITEMQTRAIIEAAMNVRAAGIPVHVEIMVPLVGNHKELRYQKNIIDRTAEQVFSERNDKIDYMVGTMIEVPRAAVTANQIAEVAQFFSFGTNDLTQMTLGFSRDDIGKSGEGHPEERSVPDPRPQRRGPAHPRGRIQGPRHAREPQVRHLRRARRRTFVGRVLPLCGSELRQLLAFPRAHRASGGRSRSAEPEIIVSGRIPVRSLPPTGQALLFRTQRAAPRRRTPAAGHGPARKLDARYCGGPIARRPSGSRPVPHEKLRHGGPYEKPRCKRFVRKARTHGKRPPDADLQRCPTFRRRTKMPLGPARGAVRTAPERKRRNGRADRTGAGRIGTIAPYFVYLHL